MNVLAFPFYDRIALQDRFRPNSSAGGVFGQYTGANRFPPFQIKRPKTGYLLDCIRIYNLDGSLYRYILHPDFPYKLLQSGTFDLITYDGAVVTGLNMPCGFYYLEVDGYFSEVFESYPTASELLVLTWRSSRNTGEAVYNANGFRQTLLLKSDFFEPEYKFEEEGDEKEDGTFIRAGAVARKQWKLIVDDIPEYLVDALNALPVHDEVLISKVEDVGQIDVKTTWLNGSVRANLVLTIEEKAPIFWGGCGRDEELSEVDQTGFEPDPSVCGGPINPNPRWRPTGNVRCVTEEYWESAEVSGQVSRNDCAQGMTTTAVSYVVPAGRFTSIVSQQQANDQAQAFFDQTKQTYANQTGVCAFARRLTLTAATNGPKGRRLTLTRTDSVGPVEASVMLQCTVYRNNARSSETLTGIITIAPGSVSNSILLSYGGDGIIESMDVFEILTFIPYDYAV